MELREVIARRRMVRRYDPDRPVPAEVRERLLEHALHAPSAGFSQGWAFLVLEEPPTASCSGAPPRSPAWPTRWLDGMQTAPLLVVVLSHKDAYLDRYAEADKGWTDRDEARWPVPYWDVDAGHGGAAHAADRGRRGARRLLLRRAARRARRTCGRRSASPAAYTPVGVVSVGYRAADLPSPSLRRAAAALDEVVHRGRWTE